MVFMMIFIDDDGFYGKKRLAGGRWVDNNGDHVDEVHVDNGGDDNVYDVDDDLYWSDDNCHDNDNRHHHCIIVRNLQVVPVYSREDIREQYCINDKELQVGSKVKLAFRSHSFSKKMFKYI